MPQNTQLLKILIERRNVVKQNYSELAKEVKDAKAIIDNIEHEILCELNESGLEMVKVDGVTVTKSSQDFYNVTDWDAMHSYIKETDSMYLLQKRLMQAGVDELVKKGNDLPVEKFTKHSVSIRKV